MKKIANGNTIVIYDVQAKTNPNLIRAVGHGTLDLFTFGLWEIIGGSGEAYLGRRVKAIAEYDAKSRLIKLENKQKDLL